ncbi:Dot/Icm type IV secretion system effector PhnB [Coxiella burnetii]|uniref:Dot/Icm type IV secretion system effector PhnB n=1 Tax=Coxiella burnetii TaxID=777 RepID=UPI0000ED03A2|nr:Dot/Icm type IV secretion system effector PhnB [Coxiella burnetii]ACJ19906.1 PhnB [Coxiella burnetii CbuK_Q154]ATN85360.1 glyoxalase [Coxiella burnetii str. Schperling]EAX32569.1 glyoxalase [Coxiella burnetii 'MSU Goat Q177']EDR35085.1 glyoxalase family protein [Coxiella burnetii Q321]PHH58245.1 VOC family protein [Coxiella burnetii]
MSKKPTAIPPGYHSITPYLFVNEATKAIEYYKKAFGAEEEMRMEMPGGKIGHAELKIGDSKIMLADEFPEMGARSPRTYGGSPVTIHFYVEDVDKTAQQAVNAGGKLKGKVENQFYGDRSGTLEDPFGHTWNISTHIEDLSDEEIRKRAAELFSKK